MTGVEDSWRQLVGVKNSWALSERETGPVFQNLLAESQWTRATNRENQVAFPGPISGFKQDGCWKSGPISRIEQDRCWKSGPISRIEQGGCWKSGPISGFKHDFVLSKLCKVWGEMASVVPGLADPGLHDDDIWETRCIYGFNREKQKRWWISPSPQVVRNKVGSCP